MSIRYFSSTALCCAGLLIMPAFLFNPSLTARCIQLLIFIFFAFMLGKKISLPAMLVFSTGIVVFNLLVPHGRLLVQAGPLRITEGALYVGLHKALTLEGLIMISKAAIRPDLQLPGFFGSLISESLGIFDKLSESSVKIDWKHPVSGIDSLLLELSAQQPQEKKQPPTHKTNSNTSTRRQTGILILAAALVLSYLPLLLLLA